MEEKLSRFRENIKTTKLQEERVIQISEPNKSFKEKFIDKLNNLNRLYVGDGSKPNLRKTKILIDSNKSTQILQREDNQDESNDEQSVDKRKFYINLVLKISLWSILWIIFIKIEFGVVYFIVSLLIIIYLSTGQRNRSKLSAYSVFNPNLERIEGTFTAEHVEKAIKNQL
jgi:hypothetical protein